MLRLREGGAVDLEVRQDEEFSRREWALERVGWVVLTLFVLAGLAGLLGSGPLSWSRSGADAVVVHYDSTTHFEADESVTLVIGPDAVRDGTAAVTVTGSWVSGVDLQGIVPEPSAQRLVPGGVLLEFDVEIPGELEVQLSFRAQAYGTLTADVGAGDDVVTFSQLVFP